MTFKGICYIFLGAILAYCWVVPLFRPAGPYVWGHYSLLDIYVGLPLVVVAIDLLILRILPLAKRRQAAFRLLTVTGAALLAIVIFDITFVVGVRGSLSSHHTDTWFSDTDNWFTVTHSDNIADDELGFARKPNIAWRGSISAELPPVEYRTDEHGFRNPTGVKHADIVFIGDSFTEGASVDATATFAAVAGQRLHVPVVNLARGCYGPQQEVLVLKRFGMSYKPRVVVWQIFEGNDLWDAAHFATWRNNPTAVDPLWVRYRKTSPIVRLLSNTIVNARYVRPLCLPTGRYGEVNLDYTYRPKEPLERPLGYEETTRSIEDGITYCQSHGITLLIVYIPIKVRVLAPFIVFLDDADRNKWLPNGKDESPDDFGNSLERFCLKANCPYLNAFEPLRNAAQLDCRRVFITGPDSHLDVKGHEVVSDLVATWLESNGFGRP